MIQKSDKNPNHIPTHINMKKKKTVFYINNIQSNKKFVEAKRNRNNII